MKRFMKKKWASFLLCLTLAFLSAVFVRADSAREAKPGFSEAALQAREDGSFHILLIADTQDTDKPQKLTIELLQAELDSADADLVIFLGDNIYGPSIGTDKEKVETAIRAVVEPVVKKGLPFLVCFGNHDDEECISKEEQLKIYQSFPGCLNEDPEIEGVGNTCLRIVQRGSDKASILLWAMDSGTYAKEGGYGYVTEEQNQWFRDGVASFGEERPVSYVFQHIPVHKVFDLLTPAKAFQKGAVCTFGAFGSDWYIEKEGAVREGRFGEAPCPPDEDHGQFQSWKDCGVKAAFFGHDHTNDYIATLEGIDVVATCGIGFYSYGRGDEHGARLLVLHTDRPSEYDTKMVYYKDLIDRPLTIFQAPHVGAQIARILFPVIGGGILLVAGIIVLVVVLVKRARKKKKAAKED